MKKIVILSLGILILCFVGLLVLLNKNKTSKNYNQISQIINTNKTQSDTKINKVITENKITFHVDIATNTVEIPACSPSTISPVVSSKIPSKLDNFKFLDYRTSTDKQCNLVLNSENYKVVIPDIAAEVYGKLRLNQLKVCSEQIEKILGAGLYRGEKVVYISKIDESQGQRNAYCCYEEPEYAIISQSNRAQFNKAAFNVSEFWRGTSVDYNYCNDGHEILHRFFNGTKIAPWANEGLATYIDEFIIKRQSPGFYNPPLRTAEDLVCYNDSYKTFPVEGGGYKKMLFRNLTTQFLEEPRIYSYYTASCFWDHIIKTYGDNKFKKIIINIYKISDKENTDFLKYAVVPVTGDEIWSYLKNMGIKP